MGCELRLTLRGELDHLRLSWQAVEAIVETLPFTDGAEQVRYDILLAVQELVTNILRHGYGRSATSLPVELCVRADNDRLEVTLIDDGPAFDPTGVSEPEFDPQTAGGFGVYIARIVMDDVKYERRGDRNEVTLMKRVRAEAPR